MQNVLAFPCPFPRRTRAAGNGGRARSRLRTRGDSLKAAIAAGLAQGLEFIQRTEHGTISEPAGGTLVMPKRSDFSMGAPAVSIRPASGAAPPLAASQKNKKQFRLGPPFENYMADGGTPPNLETDSHSKALGRSHQIFYYFLFFGCGSLQQNFACRARHRNLKPKRLCLLLCCAWNYNTTRDRR
jgi:hypothetical protein